MRKVTVANAFSISMIDFIGDMPESIFVSPTTVDHVKKIIADSDEVTSVVGHPTTAALFSNLLGTEITPNRVNYKMERGNTSCIGNPHPEVNETLVVGQYTGPRLEEGATTLPDGAEIKWFIIGYNWE